MKRNLIIAALTLLTLSVMAQNRQPQVVDKVVAVVGQNIILQSEIENQYMQYRLNGLSGSAQAIRCQILEESGGRNERAYALLYRSHGLAGET